MALKKSPFFMIMRIIGLFFMGLIVAVCVALSQVNLESLRGSVLQVLRESTGLPVEIEGEVSWKFSLRPRIKLQQVRVPNAAWAKNKYAFSADQIDVRLNLLSLFQDRPTIQNVRVYNATIFLEQNEAGEYSIERLVPEVEKTENENVKTDVDAAGAVLQPEYPFEDLGLGGVRIQNLTATIAGETYHLAGLSVRYVPKQDGREYSGWVKADDDVFPFIVSYSKYNAERKIYPMQIALATGGDALIANVALEGTSLMPIDFKVRGDIPDVAAFGKIFNMDLESVPALTVDISGGIDRKKLTLRKSSVVLRGTKIKFAGTYDWSKKIPAINLDLESKSVTLRTLVPELFPALAWVHPNRDLNVFKDIPLYGRDLRGHNIKLRVTIGSLNVYRDMKIKNIDLTLRLQNAALRVDGKLNFSGGNVRVAADADIDSSGNIDMQAGLMGRNIVVGELLRQIQVTDIISDLPVDIDFYGRANGANLSDVMKTVTGPVQVSSTGTGYIHSALVGYMYGADFLTNLRHSIQDLFRNDKKYSQMKISCVAVNTKLRNGRAETQNGVAVETNAINLRLAGNVNLGAETMHLDLTTVPVRGLKLSLSGNVVNSIEITGNLAEPDIKISVPAVAGKVASATGIGLLLAPFTGGMGLVAGAGVGLLAGDLLENWLADDTPCKTAMKRGAPAKRDDPEWLNQPLQELLEEIFNNK